MLFNTEEKNMLTGAFATGIVDTAFESFYAYKNAQGYNIRAHPEDPAYYLFYNINEWLPPVDDLISLLGVPALFWGLGKYRRSTKLKQAGVGGFIYGLSEIIGWTALKVSRLAAGQPVLNYRVLNAGGRA